MQSQYTPTPRPKKATAPFDALFADIGWRRDINAEAKLVYGKLTTMHRLKQAWTQAEIGERTGLSRHQVWRAIGDLARANLVEITRVGLGRPNTYTLRGVAADNLHGEADNAEARQKRIRAARLKQLIERYGKLCLRCGDTNDLQIDHVIPRAAGGPDDFTNLQILCRPCNQAKGTAIADYRQSPGRPLVLGADPA